MIIWIIRIILIFQVIRRNYNTTKIDYKNQISRILIFFDSSGWKIARKSVVSGERTSF